MGIKVSKILWLKISLSSLASALYFWKKNTSICAITLWIGTKWRLLKELLKVVTRFYLQKLSTCAQFHRGRTWEDGGWLASYQSIHFREPAALRDYYMALVLDAINIVEFRGSCQPWFSSSSGHSVYTAGVVACALQNKCHSTAIQITTNRTKHWLAPSMFLIMTVLNLLANM